jgi:hypothetical protein
LPLLAAAYARSNFCEQRGMATKWGKQANHKANARKIGLLEVSTLTRQGISLPLHRYSYVHRLLGLQSSEA